MEVRPTTNPTPVTSKHVPIREAVKGFPIGLNRLRQLIADGEIPASILPGRGRILVRPEAIQEWLDRQERREEVA
jgi:hypothetical protein